MKQIETALTKMFSIRYPLIGAPMFLVSNVDMVVSISEAGGIGTVPTLNYRTTESLNAALKEIRSKTNNPIGVNIIVNKANARSSADLKTALLNGVKLFITSLGSPKEVIAQAHQIGAKVFCDVTNLEHAKKVQDMGADGVIAVSTGAGGHAGPISPIVLVSWLKKELSIPVVAAGGIANGSTMAAMLTLGAAGVSVGTRFIASRESQVEPNYKEAILKSTPEDIVLTTRISGTPAAVIRTPYIEKIGLDLPWYLKILKDKKLTKKYIVPLIHLMGSKSLEAAAVGPTWKTVWSAGQSVGLIDEVLSCQHIVEKMIAEYEIAMEHAPKVKEML